MGIRRARMVVVAALVAMTLLGTALAPAGASTGPSGGGGGGRFRPGAPGVGDDYFPLYGNGGYDVRHYLLRVPYDPATDRLVGWPPSRPGRPRTSPGSTSTSWG
jgi:hypothetical protein